MARVGQGTIVREELVLGFEEFDLRRIALDRPQITIGRLPTNDVALDHRTVGAVHVVIRAENGRRTLEDLGSGTGTVVNGEVVRSKVLDHGDVIEVGVYRFRYLLHRPAQRPAHAGGRSGARLCFVSGAAPGSELSLSRSIHAVRGAGNQIAVLSRRREGWVITHLEGSAAPRVNGRPVGIGPIALADGDLIEFDGKVAQFRAGPDRE